MESEVPEEQEEEKTLAEIQEELNTKVKKFFETTSYITSRDDFDKFLSETDLLEIWNSEAEKETLWQYISKYMKNSKIDCDGALNGLNDFMNQDEEDQSGNSEEQNTSSIQKKEEKEIKETLLTRLSRVSNRVTKEKSGNKLALNRYKQRAIDQYDCLDNDSLIQFKKIFTLLKYKLNKGKLLYNDLQEICNRYKFITTDINDIWNYLSYCVCIDNMKNLAGKTELIINKEIMEEVNAFIDQKLINEDIEVDSENMEDGEGGDDEKKEDLEEITLSLVDKIIKEAVNINENNLVLNEIKKEINTINKGDSDNIKGLINGKIKQIDDFIKKSQKENELNINKMESLRENVLKISEKIRIMNEDYTSLYEKYQNNQQYDLDEESNRLIDENIMLSKENENKQLEIDNLLEDQKSMKKEYQNILMQYEDAIREKNELTLNISELKMNNYKLKGDYDKLLNDILSKTEKEKKSKKSNKNDNSNVPYEEQVKQLKFINNANIGDKEKITRKKTIFDSMSNEKLINYIMEVERTNQTLTNEKNKNYQKIHELEQKNVDLNTLMKIVKDRNIDLEEEARNLQKKIDNLSNEVRNNEIFRPSIAMNSQARISRLSKLNATGINAQKFNISKGGGFSNKKKVEKFKLKDMNKDQSQKAALNKFENISMDLYGVKEVENEEEDQENKKTEKNKIELNTNQSGLNYEGKKNANKNIDISNNKGFGINDPKDKNNKLGIGISAQFNSGNKNNNKPNLDSNLASSGMFFDGTTNDINLMQQQNNEINISQNSDSNGNIGLSSSITQFDIQNNNNIINNNNNNFKTINNNMSFQNQNSNSILENKSAIISEISNSDDMPNLRIDNLMGEMIDGETIEKNKEELDKENKNNLNINEIKNENNFNVNNSENNKENDENKNLEENRDTTIIVNGVSSQSDNLENSILNGIQKEGFNIDNSPKKNSLSSNNSNNFNIDGENKNEIIENKTQNKSNTNNLNKSKENEISMNSSSKKTQNDFSLDKSKNQLTNISKNNQKNQSTINKNSSIKINPDNNQLKLYSSISDSNPEDLQISQINRMSKVELDELRNNNYDYYSLFQEESIKRKLQDVKDKCHEFNVYSDQIFLLTEKKHLSKRYIFITPSYLYIIEPKEMKFTHVIKKEQILSFQLSNKNLNILMFQIYDGNNILIETLRLMDLMNYLKGFYRTKGNIIKIKFEDVFEVKIKGKIQKITLKDKIFSNLSNFDGAQKIGYLFVYKGTYIVPIFKEKLFVLTSIGLIMFDEPSSPPSRLYPIIKSEVQKLEGTKYNRENCFQVTLWSGKIKVFATRKKRERDSWLKEFEKINTEFRQKMSDLDTKTKQEYGK